VGRIRFADNVGVSSGIHSDAGSDGAFTTAAEVCRVDQSAAGRIHLRNEGVPKESAEKRLERIHSGKVERTSGAGDVSIARGVDGDAVPTFKTNPAKIAGINQGVACCVYFRHKGVSAAARSALKGAGCREVR